jgi:hypothetical protein
MLFQLQKLGPNRSMNVRMQKKAVTIYEGRLQSSWTHLITASRRCDDGLFFEVPLLASDALLTTLHPLLEDVLQTVDHFEISCIGAPFSWLEKPRNLMVRDVN